LHQRELIVPPRIPDSTSDTSLYLYYEGYFIGLVASDFVELAGPHCLIIAIGGALTN